MTDQEKIEWFNHAIASLEHHAIKSEKCNSDSEQIDIARRNRKMMNQTYGTTEWNETECNEFIL